MAVSSGNQELIKYGVIAVVAYFGIIKPLLQAVNIVDDAEETKAKEILKKCDFGSNSATNPLSPVFAAKAPKGSLIISSATGKQYSDVLKKAPGTFNDDESAVYGIFNKLKTQSQVSNLAYWFDKYYKQDLFTFLKDFLSESELGKVCLIVTSKPKYKV